MVLHQFLVEDFCGFDPLLVRRCCAMLEGQRLYVTGATGFFGKNLLSLLDWLHQQGARFEVNALSRAPERFLSEHPWCAQAPWLTMLQGDAGQPWPGHGRYTHVLHAATDTSASAQADKQALVDTLLSYAQHALRFCETHDVGRLLLTGSGAQFGSIPSEYALTGVPDDATLACDPTQPSSAYGEGKRMAELLASLHAERHGTAVIYTRCFAFVGPGLPLDGHFAIGNFIRDAVARQPIRLLSAGQAIRSYLYGADLAVWLLLLLLEAPGGTRVNVGSDQGLSVLQLAHKVRDVLAPTLPVFAGPARPGEERQCYLPAIQQARQLGLAPWTPLEVAIRRTAAWATCRTHPQR